MKFDLDGRLVEEQKRERKGGGPRSEGRERSTLTRLIAQSDVILVLAFVRQTTS